MAISALKAENAELSRSIRQHAETIRNQTWALIEFGQHHAGCPGPGNCVCGWRRVLQSLQHAANAEVAT